MKELRRLAIAVPAALLLLCLAAAWWTRGAMVHMPFLKANGSSAGGQNLVDQRPWQTIESLAPLAVSSEEQSFAHEAARLADHEVDQAFALALRQAAFQTRTLTGDALVLQEKVAQVQSLVKEDLGKVEGLTASLKQPNGTTADSDDLDVAKAQLQLDNDELADLTEQLARVSGDQRGQIQQELTAREAAMKKYDAAQGNTGGQIAVLSARRYGTLYGRVAAWFDQRSRMNLIRQAKAETDAGISTLTARHAEFEKKASAAAASINASNVSASSAQPNIAAPQDAVKSRVARMAQAHALSQMHSIVEDQLQTQQQLSAVYGKWLAQVELQHSIVTHLALQSLSVIAFFILCGVLLATLAGKLIDRSRMEQRRLHTLRTIIGLGIQLVTLLLVLLVIFGAPSQVPTILGLGAAGLTVVFQDFILAFFGWFILMGKNGIRVGDWVEINGVGGEVVEIGLFRTALLETGNWTDKGHPTGRRVTFINNFAISGQYFNFSTTGQWMWDEITVNIPPGVDSYKTIEAIHNTVLKQTERDAKLAEQEWQTATRQNGLSQFKATPSVDMRPAASGVDIVVRYVIRAGDRFDVRNRLYQSVIDLLHKPANTAPAPSTTDHQELTKA
ncbi:mechanosensitive ion channel family protein [Tunturibacter empetritectus]|uniref:Small-conductance mechanosensitive channel n=1 Tax=Tunturiibacter lichenicola TaxID=2051959 RepID=A0A7W8N3Y1_9BACT|nr:mechanosensitive ion channel domain-containing protein [Edaphobacter lichenicola]MBB5343036.1 small-conductance mechanosensitive channel [Edaphobacter lichenicola]